MAEAITARLALDQSGFSAGLARAKGTLQEFAAGPINQIGGQIAGAFAVGALAAFAKSIVETADRFDELSQKTGVGVEALQRLSFAAKLNSVDVEQLSQTLFVLNKNIGSALADPTGETAKAFEKMGVSLQDLQTLSPDQVLGRLADASLKAGGAANIAADLVKVLGKSAGDLAPLLNLGAEGMKNLGDQASVIDASTIQKLTQAADDFDGTINTLKASFAPFVAGMATFFKFAVEGFHTLADGAAEALAIFTSFEKIKFNLLTGNLKGAKEEGEKLKGTLREIVDAADKRADKAFATAPEKAKGQRFLEIGEDSKAAKAAEKKAEKIKSLKEEIAKQTEDLARSQLDTENQILSLLERQNILRDKAANTADEEESLKLQKEGLDIEREIRGLQDKQEEDNNRVSKEIADRRKEEFKNAADLAEIQKGKGISVSAPITDSLARIGGFVGNSGDNQSRLVERSNKILEKIEEHTRKLTEKQTLEDDFTSASL